MPKAYALVHPFSLPRINASLMTFLLSFSLFACKSTGRRDSSAVKIVGGESVQESEDQRVMASTVSLRMVTPDNRTGGCTGTVIGPNHIVTAAHCFLSESKVFEIWRESPGKEAELLFKQTPPDISDEYPLKVTGQTPHPRWSISNPTVLYDIGVISFSGKLPTDMQPAPIASAKELQVGGELLLAGFGMLGEGKFNSSLHQVKVNIKEFDFNERSINIDQGTFKGGCHADSGGPAFIDDGRQLKVIGATHGPGKGMETAPCDEGHGSFALVSLYQGWMKCTFAAHKNPLATLLNDSSSAECK